MLSPFMITAPVLATGLSPWQLSQVIFVGTFIAAQWLRGVVIPAKPGWPRLLLALPVLALFQVAGLSTPFDSNHVLMRLTYVFLISWLGSFKVLALCMDRGPIRQHHTFAQVVVILLLPIYPSEGTAKDTAKRGRLADKASPPVILLLKSALNAAVLMTVVYLSKTDLHIVVRQYLLAFGVYSFVSLLMNGPASVITHLVGLPVIPPFDKPFLSSSLAEFWSRRWNITTSSLLRVVVYDPIAEGSFVKCAKPRKPSPLQRIVGMTAAFMVSGLIHEYILWSVQPDGFVSGKWFTFFGMQAPLLVLESWVVKTWRRLQLPPVNVWIARVVTLAILEVCAFWFFFPPVESDTLTSKRVIGNVDNVGAAAVDACSRLWQAAIGAIKSHLP